MTSKEWRPEPGMLMLRFLIGADVNEVGLEIRTDGLDPKTMIRLATMRNFEASADFGHWTEFVEKVVEQMGDGNQVVVRKLATDDELRGFLAHWTDKPNATTLTEWLAEVEKETELKAEEKQRLRRIFESLTAKPPAVGQFADREHYKRVIDYVDARVRENEDTGDESRDTIAQAWHDAGEQFKAGNPEPLLALAEKERPGVSAFPGIFNILKLWAEAATVGK